MIVSFRCADTQALYETGKSRKFAGIAAVATRKLQTLASAVTLEFLRSPPGHRLEALKGNRKGQHSIRVNDQWRICFVWTGTDAAEVEIVDYH
jgi:proteic killer suppression protein